MAKPKILHCFFLYLPQTMNWAFRLMDPGETDVSVASPLLVRNRFWVQAFQFIRSPFQWHLADDEWSLGYLQKKTAALLRPLYWRYVAWTLRKDRPDVIHAHFAPVGCSCLHLAKKLKVPLVVSFYGYDYEKLPHTQPRYRKLYQKLFEEAQLFLCEGPHGAMKLVEMGCTPEKIRVLRLGREIAEMGLLATKAKPAGRLNLLQAATFVEKKGYIYTLQAFERALASCPGMTLTLVGEPVDRTIVEEVQTFIQQTNLAQSVRVLDFVGHGDFAAFLADFDVLIQPSTYALDRDCEGGAPVVLLDAQLAGLPVISSWHCDIPDLVLDGESGILCAERDVEALAAAIRRFYKMPADEYGEFSKAAQEHVQSGFDVEESKRQIKSHYINLLQNKKE